VAHVEDVTIDPSIENVLVTIKLDGAPAADAFRAVLVEAGADFAIRGGHGADMRVLAHGLKARGPAAAKRSVKGVESEIVAEMAAADKGKEAAEHGDGAAPEVAVPAEAADAKIDGVSAFLRQGGTGDAASAPSAVSSPAQAAPLNSSASTSMAGTGKVEMAVPSAAPGEPASDPFAQFLMTMSATKPPKKP